MKIIDLLNKIANGEEVPQKINFDGQGWYLDGKQYSAIDGDGANIWSGYNFNILNEEVEIIEEDNKIEKLELVSNGSENSYALLNEYGTKCGLTKHSKIMCDKINEIIDYLMENK